MGGEATAFDPLPGAFFPAPLPPPYEISRPERSGGREQIGSRAPRWRSQGQAGGRPGAVLASWRIYSSRSERKKRDTGGGPARAQRAGQGEACRRDRGLPGKASQARLGISQRQGRWPRRRATPIQGQGGQEKQRRHHPAPASPPISRRPRHTMGDAAEPRRIEIGRHEAACDLVRPENRAPQCESLRFGRPRPRRFRQDARDDGARPPLAASYEFTRRAVTTGELVRSPRRSEARCRGSHIERREPPIADPVGVWHSSRRRECPCLLT